MAVSGEGRVRTEGGQFFGDVSLASESYVCFVREARSVGRAQPEERDDADVPSCRKRKSQPESDEDREGGENVRVGSQSRSRGQSAAFVTVQRERADVPV